MPVSCGPTSASSAANLGETVPASAIVKAFHGNLGDVGIASRKFVAELFELDEIFFGEPWVNVSKKGQDPVLARVWGKHAAFLYRDSRADLSYGVTYGFTAQWGDRVAGTIADPDLGMRGGYRVRVGESVKELVAANDRAISSRMRSLKLFSQCPPRGIPFPPRGGPLPRFEYERTKGK
jgi:hypothetical protein